MQYFQKILAMLFFSCVTIFWILNPRQNLETSAVFKFDDFLLPQINEWLILNTFYVYIS